MLKSNTRILDEGLYTKKFGINGGLTIVRSLAYEKLMNLTLDELKLLFQPPNSRKIRQFGLETIVNGRISTYRQTAIHDIIDLTELAATISCQQFRDPLIRDKIIEDILAKHSCRNRENNVLRDIVLGMFKNNEIEISLLHPIHFGRLFNTTEDDSLTYVVNTVLKKFHFINKIFLVSMGNAAVTSSNHFVTTIFPSIVRALNTVSSEGRRIRGCRELTKHRNDVLSRKYYDYTVDESKALLQLLDRAISEATKNESVTC